MEERSLSIDGKLLLLSLSGDYYTREDHTTSAQSTIVNALIHIASVQYRTKFSFIPVARWNNHVWEDHPLQ